MKIIIIFDKLHIKNFHTVVKEQFSTTHWFGNVGFQFTNKAKRHELQ